MFHSPDSAWVQLVMYCDSLHMCCRYKTGKEAKSRRQLWHAVLSGRAFQQSMLSSINSEVQRITSAWPCKAAGKVIGAFLLSPIQFWHAMLQQSPCMVRSAPKLTIASQHTARWSST